MCYTRNKTFHSIHLNISYRTYQPTDKKDIQAIFVSNCPKYFDAGDLNDLMYFLNNHADKNFKVVVAGDQIVGCGGHYVKHETKSIGIAWVMFMRFSLGHSNFLSIADNFFNHIVSNIRNENLLYDIVVNTTQHMERIFNRYGFETENVLKSGFGPNLDHCVMRRKWTEF